MFGFNFSRFLVGIGLISASISASADWILNMSPGVTDVSRSVYNLHMIIFAVCVVIAVVVFGVMFYAMLKHRKSQGAVAANFHENTMVEIVWTVIPFAILIAMAIPATKTLTEIYEVEVSEVTVEIVGYQWKWHYRYLNEDPEQEISFFSNLNTPSDQIQLDSTAEKGEFYLLEVDEPLVLPTNTRVRFLITANDVIHAWWVPDLAVKKDAVPGIVNEAWTKINKEGVYRGQCAELCGKNHGYMPIVVDARSPEEFQAWRDEKLGLAANEAALSEKTDWNLDELMERGEATYNTFCAACHQPTGLGIPGAFPALVNSPVALGPIVDHIKIVVDGAPGTAMPAFGKQLSDTDVAAIVTYERNAWGNNTGDMVTPQDVSAFRAGQ